ncbi:MAG: histidine--tRNA ligase [Desulfovibrio sp.]|jgi:histidyl-tRNA synthetase|nr:histidine--tRNA ligase [Desulfovibrio sp.]
MNVLKTVKGFADLFPPQSNLYTFMENTARSVFSAHGYLELRLPILEYTELFQRGIGTDTDIVGKEMFTFPDRKGRSLTLRPEATAGVVRAYIENGCQSREKVSRFFTCGPMFRYERPQAGRMRQFHQINCECIGAPEAQTDAEILLMLMTFLGDLGIGNLRLDMNTLGCHVCRPAYRQTLDAFLAALDQDKLCPDCRRRLVTNPLRVLDCKEPGCKEITASAPAVRDHVCADCAAHFATVLDILDAEKQPCHINPRLVRGLDYYTRTTFEVVATNIGAQGAVAGGGRYDGLARDLGGPDVPGIGFACGMERLALLLGARKGGSLAPRPDFYFVILEEACAKRALFAARVLRRAGLAGTGDFSPGSLKSKLRLAARAGARYCMILGESELAKQEVLIKNMDEGSQAFVPLADLAHWASGLF